MCLLVESWTKIRFYLLNQKKLIVLPLSKNKNLILCNSKRVKITHYDAMKCNIKPWTAVTQNSARRSNLIIRSQTRSMTQSIDVKIRGISAKTGPQRPTFHLTLYDKKETPFNNYKSEYEQDIKPNFFLNTPQ